MATTGAGGPAGTPGGADVASASPRTPRSTTRKQLPGCPRRRRRTALPRPFTTSSVFTSRGALRAAGKVAIRIPLWAWARHWSGDKGIAAGPVPRSAPSQCDVESLDHDGRDVISRPFPRIRKAVQILPRRHPSTRMPMSDTYRNFATARASGHAPTQVHRKRDRRRGGQSAPVLDALLLGLGTVVGT